MTNRSHFSPVCKAIKVQVVHNHLQQFRDSEDLIARREDATVGCHDIICCLALHSRMNGPVLPVKG